MAMLSPRNTSTQVCRSSNITISPLPEVLETHTDFFGNKVFYFVVEQEHDKLTVTVNSVIEKTTAAADKPINNVSWETVREMLQASTGELMQEKQFIAATDITMPTDVIRDYAAPSFTPGIPFFKAVYHLMQRIYHNFEFTPGFTTISTPLSTVMKEKKGVCQDFAHLGISCIHAMGLPARYVSGQRAEHAEQKEIRFLGQFRESVLVGPEVLGHVLNAVSDDLKHIEKEIDGERCEKCAAEAAPISDDKQTGEMPLRSPRAATVAGDSL